MFTLPGAITAVLILVGLTWLAYLGGGLWLAIPVALISFAAYGLVLYYHEYSKFPWQP